MRQKLNENPVAQIALIGVLVVAVAFLFVTQMGGGEEEAPETGAVPPAAEAPAEGASPEAAVTPPGSGTAGQPVATPGSAPEIVAATTSASAPSDRRLPPKVEDAYADNKTIALLIVRDGGIEDHLVREATEVLEDRAHVAFFSAKAKNIARFAQITGPLGVNQAPALIVIRPKRLNGKGPAPASVTYGFQTKNDIRQTIRDAVYRGRTLTYAPN